MRTKLFTLLLMFATSIGSIYSSVKINSLYYNLDTVNNTAEVTYQKRYASDNYSSLTTVNIPKSVKYNGVTYSVTAIGEGAFYSCTNLISINISNSVNTIGDGAFQKCGITSIQIPDNIVYVGNAAFNECYGLANPIYNTHVFAFMPRSYNGTYTIPDGIEMIAGYAFSGCSNLTSVEIPNSVVAIGDAAFTSCIGLTSIALPYGITYIGYNVFNSCSNLSSVVIPNSVTSIGSQAFLACYALNSIEIPSSVTSIGDNAFGYCPSPNLIMNSLTPPTLGNNVFYPNGLSKLYVPCGTIEQYQTANGWSVFSDRIEYQPMPYSVNITPTEFGIISLSDASTICDSIKLNVTPTYGYHFTQWSDGNTENPRYILLTQDTTFSAEFEKNQYEVHTASNYDFRGTTIGDTVAYYLDTIEVQAIPNYGYHFTYWLEHNQYSNPYKFAVAQNEFLTAVFDPNKYTISVGSNVEQGVVRGENGEYDYSSELHYEAIPNNGYYFTQWSDGSTDNPRTITLTQDTAFNAEFAVLPCEQYSFYYDTTIVACGGEYISWRRYEHIPADVQGIYHYYDSLHTITGCDSVFSLTLVVGSPSYMIYYDTITEGYNLYPIGIITESGIYRDTLRTMFGCDSIQEWHIHVLPALSGKCGDSAYWDLDTISGVLMISGNGPMYNYKSASLPWRKYAQYITSAQVQEGITHLSAYAFEDIRTLLNVHLPSTLETMGNMSFYCAANIGTITCDAIIPPTGGTFKGVNSNAVIYVPCGTKGAYTDSNNWGWYFPNIEDGTYEFIEDTLICYGADLNWRGQYHLPYYSDTVIYHNDNSTLYKFGGGQAMFMDSLKSMQGCDSVYVLNAYIAPHYYEIIYDTINEGESHWAVRGNILSDTVHYNYYSTILGCDSIQEWHITVLPKSFPAPDYMFERLYGDCASKLKFTNTSHVINKFEGYENHTSYPCDACRWTFRSLSNSVIYTTTEWSPIYTCPEEGDTIEVTLTAYLGYESDSTRIDTIIVPNIMPQHTEFFYITTEDSPIKFDGRWFNRDTTYIAHYFNTYGCDSTSTLHLQVMHNYTISLLANSSKYGYVEGGGIYKQDTTITITAIPNKGYQFNQWSDGNTDNPRQVIVTQDSVFTAIFEVKMCSWLVESNDLEMGAVITNFNNEYYQYGTQITVEASPNSGYKFVKWNDGKKFNPYKFSILDDKYLLAIFMEEEEEQDTTTVQPSSTSATFTWPFIVGGFSYSLTIYLDVACTIPFCTITFNQYGQLIGITFGNRAPRRSMEQEDGFTYTVSGLDVNTEYYFKMETMDEDNKLINTDEGAFRTTNEATGIENQYNTVIEHRKVMINGQIYIIRGDKTYTLQGQEVK